MLKEQVEKIIREAGGILMAHFGKTVVGRDKTYKGDVVSEADHASEACIVAGLRAAFPGDAILAEEHPTEYLNGYVLPSPGLRPPSPLGRGAINEFPSPRGRGEGEGRLWVVDALDGSQNFVRGVPTFGISIGLIKNDVPQFGMVYLPPRQELFWAVRGQGAFLNSMPIHVSAEKEVDHMMLAMAFATKRPKPDPAVRARAEAHEVWQLNLGSGVNDACYTACGRFDGYFWTGIYIWDTAATGLILQEAGARVTNLKGDPWYWGSDPQNIVAANPVLHEKIMREIIGVEYLTA